MPDDAKTRMRQIAAQQFGILTKVNLVSLGFDYAQRTWLLQTGELEHPYPGVYRIGGLPWSWESQVLTYCWAQKPHGYASHRSAARLWGVSGFNDLAIDVLVTRHARHPRQGAKFFLHESRAIEPHDLTSHRGIPVTSPARTVVDVAAVTSEERVEFLVESVQRLGHCTIDEIEEAVDRLAGVGRAGSKKLKSVMSRQGIRGRHVDSQTNLRLRKLLVNSGFDEPELEHPVKDSIGTIYPDLSYPKFKISMECVSDTYHLRRKAYAKDSSRRNRMILAGWLMLEFTWQQVYEEPDATVAAVRSALRSRGRGPKPRAA